jgi:hypothetical protein
MLPTTPELGQDRPIFAPARLRSQGPLSDQVADAPNPRGQCRSWVDRGPSPARSLYRAFKLLCERYSGSTWAKQKPRSHANKAILCMLKIANSVHSPG